MENKVMIVGSGRITKTILDFINYDGAATFISNEVDAKFVGELAYKNNIGLDKLENKKFIEVTLESTGGELVSAWGVSQTGDEV